jgi:beta-1,4-mannooligosaccharide/beta-1,4-mannosyl-N-acetylglucosamine phosphorylase
VACARAHTGLLLSPQALYERVGDVPNVVFPCAALVDSELDRISIYYGGADTVVALAHGHLSDVLDVVRS